MPHIERTEQSAEDVIQIATYIAQDNLTAADEWILQLDRKLTTLSENPNAGRLRPRLAKNLRSFPFGQYVIFYRAIPDGIVVIRVLHGARKMTRTRFAPQKS